MDFNIEWVLLVDLAVQLEHLLDMLISQGAAIFSEHQSTRFVEHLPKHVVAEGVEPLSSGCSIRLLHEVLHLWDRRRGDPVADDVIPLDHQSSKNKTYHKFMLWESWRGGFKSKEANKSVTLRLQNNKFQLANFLTWLIVEFLNFFLLPLLYPSRPSPASCSS